MSDEYRWEAHGFNVPTGQGSVVVAFEVESSPAESCMSGLGIPLGSKDVFRSLQACAAPPEAEGPPLDVPDAVRRTSMANRGFRSAESLP